MKVGDTVIIKMVGRGTYHDDHYSTGVITRETATLVCIGERRFRRNTGAEIDARRSFVMPATPERLKWVQARQRRAELIRKVGTFADRGIELIDTATLEKIALLIDVADTHQPQPFPEEK